MHNASLKRAVELQKQNDCHEATNAACPIMSNITATAIMKQDTTTAAFEAWFIDQPSRRVGNVSRRATNAECLAPRTTAPGFIMANMTNTAITKPHATTAAYKAWSHSRARKPQLQNVWHQTATSAAGLITAT